MKVINFDSINTHANEVGLTVEIRFEWVDPNIDFEDAKDSKDDPNEFKLVPDHQQDKIWLPLHDLAYDNAVIGEIIKQNFHKLGVMIESSASEGNVNNPRELVLYPLQEMEIIQ